MGTEDYFDDQVSNEPEVDPMDAVFEKIEQANLYKALLNEQLFDEGSASPEVLEKVTQEVRLFVSQRLQMLVGITPNAPVVSSPLPFTDRQIAVLQIVADRMLNPTKPSPQPKKNIVKVRQPIVQKPNIQVGAATNKPPKRTTRTRSASISEVTGQDYSQAVDPRNKPLPPPSQDEVNNRNAALVAQNSASMNQGDWGKLLQAAAAVYQKQNANIVED